MLIIMHFLIETVLIYDSSTEIDSNCKDELLRNVEGSEVLTGSVKRHSAKRCRRLLACTPVLHL